MPKSKEGVLGKIKEGLSNLSLKDLSVLVDLTEKISGKNNGSEWLLELKKFLRKEECWPNKVLGPFSIDAVYGKRNLISAEGSVFASDRMDNELWDDNINEPGPATIGVKVNLHPISKDGTCPTIPGSPKAETVNFSFTQEQIVNFLEKNKEELWRHSSLHALIFFNRDSKGELHAFDIYFFLRDRRVIGICVLDRIWNKPEDLHRGEKTYLVVPSL